MCTVYARHSMNVALLLGTRAFKIDAKECFLFARGNAKECCSPFRHYAITCFRSPAPMPRRHAHASLKIERSNLVSFS